MRLLKLESDQEVILTEYSSTDPPAYAVLSHTWANEKHEVSYQDIAAKKGRDKLGYQKILFCGRQAKVDGLDYFWVDTCCIDKASSSEVTEAINSMFSWYHKARKCYAYLSDVSVNDRGQSGELYLLDWRLPFRSSRWFTRGWTLQELLAPESVEFFSCEQQLLGDKISLSQMISEITRIPIQAITGSPLSDFSVEERISWSDLRKTKRAEDKAYSLLGLLDTHMPLIYGEGESKAFRRMISIINEYKNNPKSKPSDDEAEQNLPLNGHNIFEHITVSDHAINFSVSTKGYPVTEKECNITGAAVRVSGQFNDKSFQTLISSIFTQPRTARPSISSARRSGEIRRAVQAGQIATEDSGDMAEELCFVHSL